jgi:hypothetical protein
MDTSKKQIESPEDFHMAMSAVSSACQLLGTFDWQRLVDYINLFEGAGSVLNPQMFMAMQHDQQWEQKKQLFLAAATFVGKVEDIRKQLGFSDEE